MALELIENKAIGPLEVMMAEFLEKCIGKKHLRAGQKAMAPETAGKAERLRGNFRKAVRKIADHSVGFSATRNGKASFEDWKAGFILASQLPPDAKVPFFKFDGAKDAVLFYHQSSLEALTKLEAVYREKLDELDRLLQVELVMAA